MQRYAGIAEEKFFSSILISVMLENIRKPTMISAGAVAKEGIAVKTGAKNIESRKSTAVVSAVSPVLPPAATPAEDSTKVVVVDVPRTAPAEVATASDIKAGLIAGSFPSLSSISAFVLTPIIVPRVSKRSTKRKANTTTIKFTIPVELKSTLKHCPKVSPSLEKSVKANVGIREK